MSSAVRKDTLKSYRLEVLRPTLLRYDRAAVAKAAMQALPPYNRSFAALCTFPSPLDPGMLAGEPGPSFWSHYRLWAVVRMTGKWPLSVLGGEGKEHPKFLRRCRACGRREVSVRHALGACRVFDRERQELFPRQICCSSFCSETPGAPARVYSTCFLQVGPFVCASSSFSSASSSSSSSSSSYSASG